LNLSNQQLQNSSDNTPKNIHLSGRASLMGSLGRCFLAEGDYPKAIQYLLLDIEQSEDDKLNMIFKMIHLTNAYIANKDVTNAKKFVRRIDQLLKDKEDKRMRLRATEMKSNYFTLINQLDSALYYTKQYNILKEAQNEIIRKNQAILLLINLEAEDRRKDLVITMANLEKERSDKKAQQILLWGSVIVIIMATISLIILTISNTAKSKSKELIEKKNKENELLLKELHHRVKNNLQVIYSLINLQKRRIDSPTLHQSLSMVQNRIKTMSLVHQNLHENENFKEVNLEAYVKTITDYLKLLYLNEVKEIAIQLTVDSSIQIIMDRAITIGLLINEIVSNSMKYAFKGRAEGLITIDVQKLHNGYQMSISDNGIGFSSELAHSKSLGLYLIENLVKQLQGRYDLESHHGTTYTIYFNA
jgi:two-component sensor histidine kinase